ncbi:hypothetical protein [Spirosoma spitsbergense]|uniref:hypothetical protein n=1 Tax=Spirosoma spitsbergense TaxID=431554 RepID=UPI000365100D|nr:hypothetical protein [Spirosoma spitsbergense]
MTPAQRRQLIEKRQQGALTDEESQQFLELLGTDPSFYDDYTLHTLVADVVREDSDQQLWEAAGRARARARRRTTIFDLVRRYPYAMAACIALLLVGTWLLWPDREPQLVKTETNFLFRADGGTGPKSGLGYAGGDLPIGKLPVKWLKDRKLKTTAAYRYCQDTLTIFVQNTSDTLYLQNNRLRYNSDSRSLSIERPDHSVTLLNECTPTPQPF